MKLGVYGNSLLVAENCFKSSHVSGWALATGYLSREWHSTILSLCGLISEHIFLKKKLYNNGKYVDLNSIKCKFKIKSTFWSLSLAKTIHSTSKILALIWLKHA